MKELIEATRNHRYFSVISFKQKTAATILKLSKPLMRRQLKIETATYGKLWRQLRFSKSSLASNRYTLPAKKFDGGPGGEAWCGAGVRQGLVGERPWCGAWRERGRTKIAAAVVYSQAMVTGTGSGL